MNLKRKEKGWDKNRGVAGRTEKGMRNDGERTKEEWRKDRGRTEEGQRKD